MYPQVEGLAVIALVTCLWFGLSSLEGEQQATPIVIDYRKADSGKHSKKTTPLQEGQ